MNLIPWRNKRRELDVASPMAAADTFRSELDRLFDRWTGLSSRDFGDFFAPLVGFGPSLDIAETDDEITVEAELPGMDPKNLDVTITGRALTIAGEKKEQVEKKERDFVHTERRFGSFKRRIELPAEVEADKVNAEFKDGVLTLKLKKVASAAPRRIRVSAAKD
jgi:HSP20 family protein